MSPGMQGAAARPQAAAASEQAIHEAAYLRLLRDAGRHGSNTQRKSRRASQAARQNAKQGVSGPDPDPRTALGPRPGATAVPPW